MFIYSNNNSDVKCTDKVLSLFFYFLEWTRLNYLIIRKLEQVYIKNSTICIKESLIKSSNKSKVKCYSAQMLYKKNNIDKFNGDQFKIYSLLNN